MFVTGIDLSTNKIAIALNTADKVNDPRVCLGLSLSVVDLTVL